MKTFKLFLTAILWGLFQVVFAQSTAQKPKAASSAKHTTKSETNHKQRSGVSHNPELLQTVEQLARPFGRFFSAKRQHEGCSCHPAKKE